MVFLALFCARDPTCVSVKFRPNRFPFAGVILDSDMVGFRVTKVRS